MGKRVRVKDAKDAKVRKAVTGLPIDHPGWRAWGWRGLPSSVSPATTDVAGGAWSAIGLLLGSRRSLSCPLVIHEIFMLDDFL